MEFSLHLPETSGRFQGHQNVLAPEGKFQVSLVHQFQEGAPRCVFILVEENSTEFMVAPGGIKIVSKVPLSPRKGRNDADSVLGTDNVHERDHDRLTDC